MTETTRHYTSPLRERHARQTRDLILDTLTGLLEDHRADEITTREIARLADVSERTVYRHFPDRQALLVGLGGRLKDLMDEGPPDSNLTTIDDLAGTAVRLMAGLDRQHVAARAEALFNADPRHFSDDTRANSDRFRALVAAAFPHLEEREQVSLTAVIRCLLSAQAWLRMREEFGVPGEESGPMVAWVLEVIFGEVRRGGRIGGPTEA